MKYEKKQIPSDHRTYLLRVLFKQNRALGYSFQAAMGRAIQAIDGADFDWTQHFQPTERDLRKIAAEEAIELIKDFWGEDTEEAVQ